MDDYIDKLMKVGLTLSEAKVYQVLLKKKNFSATEISKLAHISRQKAYEVIEKLEQRGLCTETLGKIKKYNIVNPQTGFDNLYKEFEEKKKLITELSDSFFPIYNAIKDNTGPLDYITVLRDKNTIINTFYKLEEQAEMEVLGFVRGPYMMMDMFKTEKQMKEHEEFNSLKKGIVYKCIHEAKDLEDQMFSKCVDFFAQAGDETRVLINLPLPFKAYVYDEKIVMITLQDKLTDKTSVTCLVIEHPDLAKGLKIIFDLYWQNSMTLEEFKIREMK